MGNDYDLLLPAGVDCDQKVAIRVGDMGLQPSCLNIRLCLDNKCRVYMSGDAMLDVIPALVSQTVMGEQKERLMVFVKCWLQWMLRLFLLLFVL